MNLLKNPVFQNLLDKVKEKHEENVALGTVIRKEFPNSVESFPGIPKNRLIKILVSTCGTKQEIKKVLKNHGLGKFNVSVMEIPVSEEEKTILAVRQLVGGVILNKDYLICTITEIKK